MADQSNADDLREGADAIHDQLPERWIGDVVADLNRQINVEQAAGNEDLTSERTQELSTAQAILATYTTTGRLSDEAIARAHQIVTRQPPPPITRAKPEAVAARGDRTAGVKPLNPPATPEQLAAFQARADAAAIKQQEAAKSVPLESPEIPPDREAADALKYPAAESAAKPATGEAARTPAFAPTTDWQDVPDGAVLPPGLQIQMNVATGRNQARRQPPQEPPAQQPASSATPQQPAPVSPAARPPQPSAASPAQPQVAPATHPAVPVATDAGAARHTDAAAPPPPQGQQAPAASPVANAGAGRGAQPPATPPPASAPATPEPDPSRSLFSKIASAITGAIQSVMPNRQGTADQVQAADREAQQAGGTTAPQHPLVEAAGRALAGDQDLANQNRQQFMAAQTSDEGLPPTLQSPEAYYAATKLGYRPGDRNAHTAAGRRDRSDDPGMQWRDLGDVGEEPRHEAALRLQRTREDIQNGSEIPADREALAQALRRNENLTAADAYVIQQRQEHGTDPQVVPPPRKASFAERMLGIKDDDEDKDGLRTAKMVGAVEYGEHAIRQYASAGSEGARPFVGDAPAAIAGSAGQAVAGIAGGAGTIAAGVAAKSPMLVAKGVADVGAELIKLPSLLVDWSDALISSADNIKQFSSVLANAFAVAELRTMQRDFASAQRTGDASANLIDARQDLADTLQPIKDSATNALSKDIANGLRDLNDIVSMFRELLQWAGVMKSDEELKEELQRKGTPFQETIKAIEAGGFAAQNPDGQWAVANLEGQFGGQGMGGLPAGFGQGAAPPTDPATEQPATPRGKARAPTPEEQEQIDARIQGARAQGAANRAEARKKITDPEKLVDFDNTTRKIEAGQKRADTARQIARQQAIVAEQREKFLQSEPRPDQQQDQPARGGRDRMVNPDGTPQSPHPAMPGPFRDRRDQKVPKVHPQPKDDEEKGGISWAASSIISGASAGTLTVPYLLSKLLQGQMQTDTKPPSQTAGNVP